MFENETILGPAHALNDLKTGEPCLVILDKAGVMFVRQITDKDILANL